MELRHTPLYEMHIEAGAKMVPFAGYSMPVQYPLGVKKEHLHTREAAGLFDVSHMGQIKLTGRNAAAYLERLVPIDVIDLPVGKQRYGLFTNEKGGIEDDLMVANLGEALFLVVNAARIEHDLAILQRDLPEDVGLELLQDRALLALQGPQAVTILSQLNSAVSNMLFMDVLALDLAGIPCIVSRSGYTGEDGFEISVTSEFAKSLADTLLQFDEVEWVGLGARDSLRLEAGLCLYGHDLDSSTTPVEASLIWAVSPVRRLGGAREGHFVGANVILQQIASKRFARKRVGLIGLTKAPVREGTQLFDASGNEVGIVTSGTLGPTINRPISMAYVHSDLAVIKTEIFAEVRGKRLAMEVVALPFVPQRYFRGKE
nr:glycine cleavage system aminomethyltransferase GcvT [Vibrio agarilyticus]